MQFAHSGSQTEKQPPPHPALPYDVTAGAPHSAESAPSHGAAPRSLQAPHLHHPTAPRPRLFTPLHPCRSMMPGTHRPITPYPCLFAALHLCRSMALCANRPTAPYLRHTMLPSPTPLTVPRQVRSPPRHCSRAAGSLETKSDQNCNFFAIGNCRRCPNHGSSPENEAKRPPSASFPLYR